MNKSLWIMDKIKGVVLFNPSISIVCAFKSSVCAFKASYTELLHIVSKKMTNLGYQLDPSTVMVKFKSAIINQI